LKIIPRAEHHISRKLVDTNALKVLYRLAKSGYDAYLVGGCVRDLLLNHRPKDFDVVTNAKPEEVKKIFSNCRIIGRRFRLAHVYFKDGIVEVATFRAGHNAEEPHHGRTESGLIVRDNVYGTIEEDAWRRDFTINALYYNIKDFSVVDFTHGYQDLKEGKLRVLGDPETRYREDPVRIIRAIRIASKLEMKIVKKSAAPIIPLSNLLDKISSSRLFDEVVKLFHTGHASQVLPALLQYKLFSILFPPVAALFNEKEGKATKQLLTIACSDTDKRINDGKSISCAFLFAFLLWMPVEKLTRELHEDGHPIMEALQLASKAILDEQSKVTALPRRFISSIHDIWHLQFQLPRSKSKSIYRCLENSRFRAGFDLLLLRSKVDDNLKPLVEWWTEFQQANASKQKKLLDQF
jgi:poly(A) polymerase